MFCRSGMVMVCRGFRGKFRVVQAVEFGRFYLFCQSGMVVIGREVGRGEWVPEFGRIRPPDRRLVELIQHCQIGQNFRCGRLDFGCRRLSWGRIWFRRR